MSDGLILRREGRVATLTINRPPLNILDLQTIIEMDRVLAELGADPDLQLLVLRGAGEKAFSAGVAVEDHTADKLERMLLGFHGAIARLRDLPALTLAVVPGHCLGGGMELAMACDLVLAGERARFGQPEVNLACFPPVGAALYPSLIGAGRTLELLVTGRALAVEEAERLGLVTWRVASEELEHRLAQLTAEITGKSAPVVRLIKRAVRAGSERPFAPALAEAERLYLEELAATTDMSEGLAAFVEKRAPQWRHR